MKVSLSLRTRTARNILGSRVVAAESQVGHVHHVRGSGFGILCSFLYKLRAASFPLQVVVGHLSSVILKNK